MKVEPNRLCYGNINVVEVQRGESCFTDLQLVAARWQKKKMKIPGSIGHDRVSIACLRIGQANFRRLNDSSRGVKDLASQGPGGGGLNITGRHDTAIAPTWEPLSVDLGSILTHEKPTGCFETLYHFHDTLKTLQAAS